MANNILQAVQTYQKSGLGILDNMFAFIHSFNKKFKNFENMTGNLGDTVTYDLPVRMISRPGLVVGSFDAVVQRTVSLTVDQAYNVNFDFTAQQLVFNIENNDYMPNLMASAMEELGSFIEADVASAIPSSTYLFFGTPASPVARYQDLAQAVANMKTYGVPRGKLQGYLGTQDVPTIVGTGQSLFIPETNEKVMNSWEVGNWATANWMQSNLLPLHQSGNVGNDATTLTVVSIDATGTILTLSGAGISDADAVLADDLFQFQDGVAGQSNIRFRSFTGHAPTGLPVQFRATATAGSDGAGQVVVTIEPALLPLTGAATDIDANVTVPVVAGMQVKALADHRCGLLLSGDGAYLAMPQLPDQSPFYTANKADMESGASIRLTSGAQFGQNSYGSIYDCIWGKRINSNYAMRLIFAA